jgi:hypothetical protein
VGEAPSAAPAPAASAAPAEPIGEEAERKVVLENDAVRAELTNRGAQLVSLVLKDKRLADGSPLELVGGRRSSPYPLALVAGDGSSHPLNDALFRVDSEERAGISVARFAYRGERGAATKTVTLAGDGRMEIELEVPGGLGTGGRCSAPACARARRRSSRTATTGARRSTARPAP